MHPLFLNLTGRRVVFIGEGRLAEEKLDQLRATGADLHVVSPAAFVPADLDSAWLAVSVAPPDVNRQVAAAADARHIFVNAVDDPAHGTAYLSGVVRRAGVTIAISTEGRAPALTALLREAIDLLLPADVDRWLDAAQEQRTEWKRSSVPMEQRKPRLLEALNKLYREGSCG